MPRYAGEFSDVIPVISKNELLLFVLFSYLKKDKIVFQQKNNDEAALALYTNTYAPGSTFSQLYHKS